MPDNKLALLFSHGSEELLMCSSSYNFHNETESIYRIRFLLNNDKKKTTYNTCSDLKMSIYYN